MSWTLIIGHRLFGFTDPGLNTGLLNGTVGLTSDGEKARFISGVPHFSVKNNLSFSYSAGIHNFLINLQNEKASETKSLNDQQESVIPILIM